MPSAKGKRKSTDHSEALSGKATMSSKTKKNQRTAEHSEASTGMDTILSNTKEKSRMTTHKEALAGSDTIPSTTKNSRGATKHSDASLENDTPIRSIAKNKSNTTTRKEALPRRSTTSLATKKISRTPSNKEALSRRSTMSSATKNKPKLSTHKEVSGRATMSSSTKSKPRMTSHKESLLGKATVSSATKNKPGMTSHKESLSGRSTVSSVTKKKPRMATHKEAPKEEEDGKPKSDELTAEELEALINCDDIFDKAEEAKSNPKTRGKASQKSLRLEKGDIVWIIYKREGKSRSKMRPVADSDLERTADDFSKANEILGGGLFVVQTPRVKGSKVGVYPVFDRPDKNKNVLEKWNLNFAKPFDRYVLNSRIIEAIRRSIHGRLKEKEYQEYWSEVQKQFESASRFTRMKLVRPEMCAKAFLTSDEEAKSRYFLNVTRDKEQKEEEKVGGRKKRVGSSIGDVPREQQQQDGVSLEEILLLNEDSDASSSPECLEVSPSRSSSSSSEIQVNGGVDRAVPSSKKYKYANSDILEFFRTEVLQEYLEKIMTAAVKSTRHDLLTSGKNVSFGYGSKVLNLSNPSFLEDDGLVERNLRDLIRATVYNRLLDRIEKQLRLANNDDYIFHCLVPEGLIYYIVKRENVDQAEAERIYLEPNVSEEELRIFDAPQDNF